MDRRGFLKLIPIIPLVAIAPTLVFASNTTNIWDEDPKTVIELYDCINKYCTVVGHSNKMYEEVVLEGGLKRFAHVTYALITGGINREKRLCFSFWTTMRTKILSNEKAKPYIMWRRVPCITYSTGFDAFEQPPLSMKQISMRISLVGDSSYSRYIKAEGERVKSINEIQHTPW